MAYVIQDGKPVYVPEPSAADIVQARLKALHSSVVKEEMHKAALSNKQKVQAPQWPSEPEVAFKPSSKDDVENDNKAKTAIAKKISDVVEDEQTVSKEQDDIVVDTKAVKAIVKEDLMLSEQEVTQAQQYIESHIPEDEEPTDDGSLDTIRLKALQASVTTDDDEDIKDSTQYGMAKLKERYQAIKDQKELDSFDLISLAKGKDIRDAHFAKDHIAEDYATKAKVILNTRSDDVGFNASPRPVDVRYATGELENTIASNSNFVRNLRKLSSAVGSNQFNLCVLSFEKDPSTGLVNPAASSFEEYLTQTAASISDCATSVASKSKEGHLNWEDAWMFRIKGITIPGFKKAVENITYGTKALSLATAGLEYSKSLKFDLQLDSAFNLGEAILHMIGLTETHIVEGKHVSNEVEPIPLETMYSNRGVDTAKKTSHSFDLTSLSDSRWYETHYLIAVAQTLTTTSLFNSALSIKRSNEFRAKGGHPYAKTTFLMRDFKLATADAGLQFDVDKSEPVCWPVTCTYTGLQILSSY